jgi:outer membrane lipoprotein SlyB
MSESSNRVSPIVAIAALSVIVFSAVGVGVLTGLIPNSFSKSAPQAAEPVKAAAPAPVPEPRQAAAPQTDPARSARAPAQPAPAPARSAAPRVCAECGTVVDVRAIEQEGEPSGLGAVAGGIAGGLLGNQIGHGSGRRIATVAGVAGGAYAGHQIEKHLKKSTRWEVAVRMDDGTMRSFLYEHEPAVRPGTKVKVVDGALVAS